MILCLSAVLASGVGQSAQAQAPSAEDAAALADKLHDLKHLVEGLRVQGADLQLVADVAVYAKAADWILRHQEFYTPQYVKHTKTALATGHSRAELLANGKSPWDQASGTFIRGYVSEVDGSVQPYAIAVPAEFGKEPNKRWPVHLVLHGRGDKLNEVSFINSHDYKPVDAAQTWIQIDVFGRTNNAYRWSGETDVFEALAAAKKRYRIDTNRIVLRGFSMGGAGSWHLGLHHPSQWCAVGPGAGFVDFYKYQKAKEKLPSYQDQGLKIYDSIEYALNAFDVPICTYGGELDAQLVASTSMVERAKELGAPLKLIVGPGVGHKFHPDSYNEFLAFLNSHMERGRNTDLRKARVKFITHTLKYNTCDWATIEEMQDHKAPALVEGEVDDQGVLKVATKNIAVLQILRHTADEVDLDGTRFPLSQAAQGLLPEVCYRRDGDKWLVLDYDASRRFTQNPDRHKRRDLQGPIDDAFMRPFVCVRATGRPWSDAHADWSAWTLARFTSEFDKWLRGQPPVIDDHSVNEDVMLRKNLILFGDPSSNSVIAKLLPSLPLQWTETTLTVAGKDYDPKTHGVSLIYPNPLAPQNYIVINSGHTFHEKDFKASNAWLFPRLGDIAVQKFERDSEGGFTESTVWADLFDNEWELNATPTK